VWFRGGPFLFYSFFPLLRQRRSPLHVPDFFFCLVDQGNSDLDTGASSSGLAMCLLLFFDMAMRTVFFLVLLLHSSASRL